MRIPLLVQSESPKEGGHFTETLLDGGIESLGSLKAFGKHLLNDLVQNMSE